MELSSQPSQEEEIQDPIITKLKREFEDEIDLQKFDYYVRPLAEANAHSQNGICLLTEVNKYIVSEYQCSLLILGDSGNGKSLLGQYVAWQLWKEYQPDKIVPLFIHLPLIPQANRAQELLESYLKKAGLNKDERIQLIQKNKLLLVLDGYDEIPEIGNLYKQNRWEKLKVKMITTCRPEALLQRQAAGNSYQELFFPKETEEHTSQDRFVEFHLKKFNLEQIDEYLKQYLSHSKDNHHYEDWNTYKQNLNTIPGLLELVATPFILSIVVKVLPQMIKRYEGQALHEQRKLVRADIYDCFVEDWFKSQVERFREQGKLNLLKGSLKQYLINYSQNLAYKALSQGRLEITFSAEETLNPELLRPKNQEFMPQYTSDFSQFTEEVMKYIRSGCLLKTGTNDFSFLHKSLIEYFAAQDLFAGIHLSAELYTRQILPIETLNKSLHLNENLLMQEPAIIKMLADRVETDPLFNQLLYDVIAFSKVQPLIAIAAANAITVLNVAGESFSGKSFSGIQIPYADLSGAICDQTDFSSADLTGVRFHHAWLNGANFSQTQMSDVDFAELPGFENSCEISSFCIAPNEKSLLIGDIEGKLSKWCLISGKLQWKKSLSPQRVAFKLASFVGLLPICGIAISPDNKKAAIGSSDNTIYLWDLEQIKQIKCLTPCNDSFGDIFNIKFCPYDGNKLIFCLNNGGLHLWNIEINKHICLFRGSSETKFAIKSKEKLLISYDSYTDSLVFYDPETLTLHSTKNINEKCEYFCFSPKAKYLGVVVGDSQVKLLDPINGKSIKTFSLDGVKLRKVHFSPDESLVIANSDDKFHFWHIDSGMFLYDLVIPFQSESVIKSTVEFKPLVSHSDPKHLFYLVDRKVYVWQIQATPSSLTKCLSQSQACNFQEEENYFRNRIKPGAASIFLGTEPLEIDIYDAQGFFEITRAQEVQNFSLNMNQKHLDDYCFIFSLSLNQRFLALAIFNDMWEDEEYKTIKTVPLLSAGASLIGRFFTDADIRVFDLEKNQQIHTFRHANQIHYMKFSEDNEWLITAGNTVRIWNMSTGKCLHRYSEHKNGTNTIALTSNKRFLVIADGANSVTIWDTSTHKSVGAIQQFPFKIHRMLFIKNDNYLLCQTEEGDQLLLRFHYDGKKAILNLIESSRTFNFNCFEANLQGAYGLSSENQRLLHQKGAIGKPSDLSEKPKSKNGLLQILKFSSAPQPAIKIRVESAVSSKAPILYDNWVISMMRKPSGKMPEHVFLVIEGVDQFGKGILGRIDLVDNREKVGYGLIIEKCLHGIPTEDLKKVFWRDLADCEGVYSKSWSVPRSRVLVLAENIEKDKQKEIKYYILGNSSIFGKSSSVDGHNCFTWAREKLFSLGEEKIENDLRGKWTDVIAAKPSLYLPAPKK